MALKNVLTSSVGKKLVMGFTGIFLILFLVVHAGLNACIWANDGGEMFNKAAHFMGSNVVPRILEIGLFGGIFLHIIQGYMLTLDNRSKRAIGYEVDYSKGSKWYSRSMAILGTILLLFFILHWKHFWVPSRFTGIPFEATLSNGLKVHDVFALMKDTFSEAWVVIAYVIGCGALGYHLAHGFQSAFKTIGVHNRRYHAMLSAAGLGFSIAIPGLFALMPLSFYFGWIH
jgi:succinate dehydrogenase / fumarate reductase, cytochrome b subunit